MKSKEKNIQAHNKDVKKTGKYLYSDPNILSAKVSNATIQEHLSDLLLTHVGKGATILDVGCGDGVSTVDLARRVSPKKMIGIEPADAAVAAAKKNNSRKEVSFEVADAYKVSYKPRQFDVVMIRSVLHHLYEPEKAIANVAKYGKHILIMEPNGYNPILKVIEKVSPYHREHEERSFFPPTVHGWVRAHGFDLVESRFINIVPTFAPAFIVPPLKTIEPFIESIPVIKHLLCAQNLTLWRRLKDN